MMTFWGGGFAAIDEPDVDAEFAPAAELAAELVRTAHQLCPYSKATRGNIDTRLKVNGRPLD